jgi:hypothetical protein
MNTPTTPETDETARLEKLRTQLSTDIEAMQQKEASLREYEQKLRLLVEHAGQIQQPQAASQNIVLSATGQTSLDSEWEKFQRANALMEAARRSLTDDRLALREREERVLAREQEVARRETWLKAREAQLVAKAEAEAAVVPAAKAKPSFTQAPFLAARNLLHLGKPH